MANKITQKDIENINDLYLEYGTYAAVARATGFAASTIKKYVVPGYKKITFCHSSIEPKPINELSLPQGLKNRSDILLLNEEDLREIAIFKQNEVSI